jgi:hypothetical protein
MACAKKKVKVSSEWTEKERDDLIHLLDEEMELLIAKGEKSEVIRLGQLQRHARLYRREFLEGRRSSFAPFIE